jgi:predicted exporter
LLGFATLIFVSAKPLRRFGISGAIAAALAMLCAYTLFPPFLRAAKARPRNRTGIWKSLEGFVTRKHPLIAASVLVTALVLAPFAWRTNSDPDLLRTSPRAAQSARDCAPSIPRPAAVHWT